MIQTGVGVASVGWDISSLTDGEYDMMIQVGCEPSQSPLPSASMTYSPIANLLVDRQPPVEFAQHARPAGPYFPGDDISMAFNEPIVSSGITVTGLVSDGTTLGSDDFLQLYASNSVFLDFSPYMSVLVCWLAYFVCHYELELDCYV